MKYYDQAGLIDRVIKILQDTGYSFQEISQLLLEV